MQLLIVMVFQCTYAFHRNPQKLSLMRMKRGSLQTRQTLFEDTKGVIRTRKEGQTIQ